MSGCAAFRDCLFSPCNAFKHGHALLTWKVRSLAPESRDGSGTHEVTLKYLSRLRKHPEDQP